MPRTEIRPQPGPQTAFLETSADIAIYGGAAGGGKTWALLLECLRWIRIAMFGAVIFRRLSTQLKNEGGLWDEASNIYPLVGGVAREGSMDYRWPGGASISFRHLKEEKTKYGWQGSQVPLLVFDELTHFSESQFFYLLSRNRSMCGVRPYVRASTNPDAGSWVKRLVGPWVDRKHALYPTPPGVILYFIRHQGHLQWARSREEMAELFPGSRPKSITFIAASIFDNQALLRADPDYLANLEAQSPVERARLLLGDWDVVNEGLVYPDFGTIVVEPDDWPTDLAGKKVGGLDWGFRDPFAGLMATEDVQGNLWVEWEHYEPRMTLTAISEILPRCEDNEPRWWADPAGATQIAEVRRGDHDVVPCSHLGTEPIKSGVAVVTERIRSRSLFVRGDLGSLIDEAGKYRYPESGSLGNPEKPLDRDNHLMDALRYLVVGNDRGRVVKDEAPPQSQTSIEAREMAAEAKRDGEEAEYYDPDAEHWWS
jgi:hypothetical protein